MWYDIAKQEEKNAKKEEEKGTRWWPGNKWSSFKLKPDKGFPSSLPPGGKTRFNFSLREFCVENFLRESSSRNTVPSDADSRPATFLIRHAGKIYFQPAADGRTASRTACARNRCSSPTTVDGEARAARESKASGEWPISVASSGSNNVGYYINQGEKTKFSLSVFSR